jgi:hypothetical protein
MFSQLPNPLDRDFAIGFFLPAAVLAGGVWLVLTAFGFTTTMPDVETLTSAAIAVFAVWLISVALLALNYPILRCLEGYPSPLPKWHPLNARLRFWKGRFRTTVEPALQLDKQIDGALAAGIPIPLMDADAAARDMRNAAQSFPDEEQWVLATQFGNNFRALEVYSRVIYGIDAIPAWPRLMGVLPDDFRKQMSEANSLLAFSVNLIVGLGVTVSVYLLLAVWNWRLPSVWLPVVASLLSIGSYKMALVRVRRYGEQVKSAFDLFRGELAKQLGLELPRSASTERKMWENVNKMMVFRSQRYLNELDKFRSRPMPEK